MVRNTPSEEVLWGYTTQLAAVLRAAHSMGLALRPATLSATKVGAGGWVGEGGRQQQKHGWGVRAERVGLGVEGGVKDRGKEVGEACAALCLFRGAGQNI